MPHASPQHTLEILPPLNNRKSQTRKKQKPHDHPQNQRQDLITPALAPTKPTGPLPAFPALRLSRRHPPVTVEDLALMLEIDLALGRRQDFQKRLLKALQAAAARTPDESLCESHLPSSPSLVKKDKEHLARV